MNCIVSECIDVVIFQKLLYVLCCAGVDEGPEKHFTDRDICRPFLLDICISDLFTNTRAELPDCQKVHSITMKEEYEKASRNRDYHYEEEVLDYLKAFLADNDR